MIDTQVDNKQADDDSDKSKKIWITRPSDEARILSTSLKKLGYDTVVEPLLKIQFKTRQINTKGCQAVIFTSSNGVKAYIHNNGDLSLPAYVVGAATAYQARKAHFKNTYVAKGDVIFLSDMIKERIDPLAGTLYYAAGSAVAKDLATLLSAHKYTVRRQTLYEAVPIASLKKNFLRTD